MEFSAFSKICHLESLESLIIQIQKDVQPMRTLQIIYMMPLVYSSTI